MRNLLAFFLLLIFSFQILPVRTIGKLLTKGTQTEDVKEDGGDEKGMDGKYDDLFLCNTPSELVSPLYVETAKILFNYSNDLVDSHIKDILCPPPNC